MDENERRDGAVALRLITDHIKDCTQARIDTKAAVKEVRNILFGLIGAIGTTLIVFGGYQYASGQALQEKLTETEVAANHAANAANAASNAAQAVVANQSQ